MFKSLARFFLAIVKWFQSIFWSFIGLFSLRTNSSRKLPLNLSNTSHPQRNVPATPSQSTGNDRSHTSVLSDASPDSLSASNESAMRHATNDVDSGTPPLKENPELNQTESHQSTKLPNDTDGGTPLGKLTGAFGPDRIDESLEHSSLADGGFFKSRDRLIRSDARALTESMRDTLDAEEASDNGLDKNGTQLYVKALDGYAGVLEKFLSFKLESSSAKSKGIDKLILMTEAMRRLRQDTQELIDITNTYKHPGFVPANYQLNYVLYGEEVDYHKSLRTIIERKLKQWQESSSPRCVFMPSGYRSKGGVLGHAAYFAVYEDNGEYYRAEYNAGDESPKADRPEHVIAVDVRKIDLKGQSIETVLQEMMIASCEKRIRNCNHSSYYRVHNEYQRIEDTYYPAKNRDDSRCLVVPKQKKANCTTRSLREILRHWLTTSCFNQLLSYQDSLRQHAPYRKPSPGVV